MQAMQVRGAPAIAIAAALGLAVELINGGRGTQYVSKQEALQAVQQKVDYLCTRYAARSGTPGMASWNVGVQPQLAMRPVCCLLPAI